MMNTTLILEILDFEESLLIKNLSLKIAKQDITVRNKNILNIQIYNFPKNVNDYYIEKIELILNGDIKRYFRFRIYKNRISYYYIFLNKLSDNSFEISYFNKISENLPKILNITIEKKNYYLKEICKTDLLFIKSFGIINCPKTITINENQEISLEDKEKGSFVANFISSRENYLIHIIKIHKKYYPELKCNEKLSDSLKHFIKNVKEKLNSDITKSNFSIFLFSHIKFWESLYLPDCDHFIANKIYPLNNDTYSLLLNYITYLIIKSINNHTESFPILKTFFHLLSFLENKMAKNIITQRDIISFSYYFYEHYCSVEQYKKCLNYKINSYNDLYINNSTDWLDFEIVFIKECKKDCSYYKAIKLLEEVLDNLNPKSLLLEILFLINSDVGKIRRTNKISNDAKRKFNLSLITKENIISHIKGIIPNMIIRKNETGDWKEEPYAECDIYSGIMTIYEKTLFKKDISKTNKFLIEDPDNEDRYSICIFLCLLHVICSHLKLSITDKIIKSPNIINDPHNNYNELKLENGESGRTMEYYISKDINRIKFLKFSFSPKKVLYNPILWTEENFENLNKIIENLMENQSKRIFGKYYRLFSIPTKYDERRENKKRGKPK